MGDGQPGCPVVRTDRDAVKNRAAMAQFYLKWKQTPEAKALRPPGTWYFLQTYPKNFSKVRSEFELAWMTHKLTR